MLKVLWNLVGRAGGVTEKVQSAGPARFEALEPRLLLNADMAIARPPQSEFPSADYAIHVDLNAGDNLPQADVTPVLTVDLETEREGVPPVDSQPDQSSDATVDSTPAVCGQAGPAETDPTLVPVLAQAAGEQLEHDVVASAETFGSPVLFPDEQTDPAVSDRQEIALSSQTPSLEIRGPPSPSRDSADSLYETTYEEESPVWASADAGSVSTAAGRIAPALPGLRLVDPDTSNWHGQIIYLDFGGGQNVTYHGPVTIGPFDLPAFSLEGTALAGQEGAVTTEVAARLQQVFAGSGVIFTLERPEEGTPYSTIRIGGDDSVFSAYGSFLGLSEQVDVGNASRTDDGFVFSDELLGTPARVDGFADQLSQAIAHEAGHLLGYEHDAPAEPRSTGVLAFSEVALAKVTVLGNGVAIANGDTTPGAADYTDFGSMVQGGDPITRTFTIRNDGTTTLTLSPITVPTGYTVMESPPGGLAAGEWDTFTVRLDTGMAGTQTGDISFSNNDPEANPFHFRIMGRVTLPPTEQFTGGTDSFDLSNKALLFTPGTSDYTFTLRSIMELPTSPAGGTRLLLADDDALPVTLASGKAVLLYRESYNSFYVGSNGNITFTSRDFNYYETPDLHYSMPRVSVLFDDLNPELSGQVSWQQFPDRAVVTWDHVPDFDTEGACTFQATLYFDGRIELAWLAVASPDGLVGLSNGSGLATPFTETDFSQSLPGPPEIAVLGNGVSITNDDATPSAGDHTDFGSVVRDGAAISRVFTVRNDGLSALTLGAVTVPTGFTLVDFPATSLAPGAVDTFTVRLDTALAGTSSGEISFATNDTDENPFHFRITGTVLVPAEVTVLGNGVPIINGDAVPGSADHTDFGSVVLSGPAMVRIFTVRNDGGSTLTLGAVSVPAGFTLTEGLSTSLAPGEADTFTVQLDTAPVGDKSGEIVFSTNDTDENPFHFQVVGRVVLVAQPDMGVLGQGILIAPGDTTPNPVDGTDFGTIDVGRPLLRTYTIENRGSAVLSLTGSPHITISGSSDFSVVAQPADSVAAGESTTFQIRFRPSSAGVKTATVRIANSDSDKNPYTFTMQGTGVAWDFTFYDDFDDGDFAGWSAVDPVTGAPTTAPQVVASPEGYALRGIGSGYVQDPALDILLTHALPTGNVGELKIEMRAKAGPDRPNVTQVQLVNGDDFYTVADDAMNGWDPNDQANWYSWVGGAAQQSGSEIPGPAGAWHDFRWVRNVQGQWSLFVDGQLKSANFQTDNQLRSFTKLAVSLLRDQSEIEWIAISGNALPPSAFAMPVYRFWSPIASDHFYTISAAERDKLINKFPYSWTYEGTAFYAFPDGAQAGTVPIYRLWSPTKNTHVFTIDQAQKDKLLASSPQESWIYEGIGFYIYPVASHPADARAVYRFWSPKLREDFFTMSTAERDYIRSTYPSSIWTYEDEAWYAFDLS